MNWDNRETIYQQAKDWVLEAGKTIRANIDDPLTITTKADPDDLVTTVDRYTEYFFTRRIKETFPDHLIISEEGYGDSVPSLAGTIWIIDPIDGTMNFVHQKRNFAISVGIYRDGVGEIGLIYDVMADTLYHAKKGEGAYKNGVLLPVLREQTYLEEAILGLNHFWLCDNHLVDETVMQHLVKTIRGSRTYGSAALEFAFVAEGVMDGYMTMDLSPWDIAAGIVIVNEVGASTQDAFGQPLSLLQNSSVLTCNPAIEDDIVEEYMKKGRK